MSEQAWRWWTDRMQFERALRTVDETYGESKDGDGCADHDTPYYKPFLTSAWHYPFREWEFARLLVMRGKFQDGMLRGDTFPEPLKDEMSS